jgi:hypothetical protein
MNLLICNEYLFLRIGDSRKVDKLVKDVYGGDYVKFGLSGKES